MKVPYEVARVSGRRRRRETRARPVENPPPSQLTIVVNTGDDEVFHGLHVSPDVDTVMYTLAGLSNPETGWGITGETFQALGG